MKEWTPSTANKGQAKGQRMIPMSKANQPAHVTLTAAEAEALKARVNANALTAHDIKLISGLIAFNLWLQQQLSSAKLSIGRLKRLFGFATEKKTSK